MKQSTSFAQVATNLLNVLQGYTKGIRFVAVLTMLLTVGIGQAWGADATATLSFANKAQRTSFSTTQQIWEQNGVTFTNDKASSSNAVADYANPARMYASSSVTVECSLGNMTKIVFDCNTTAYATAMKNSIGSSATASSDKVTVTLDGTSNTFTVAKLTAQVRLDAITVTYTAAKKTIYLAPNIWHNDNPKYAVHTWNNSGSEDVLMELVEDCKSIIYKAEINANHTNAIFIRGNKDSYVIDNPWANVWNQTIDLTLSSTTDLFTVNTWGDKSTGSWSTYTPSYSVTFKANGHGTAPQEQCVTKGNKVTKPADLSADGYKFGGWYTTEACTGTAYDFNTTVTGNIPLYAKWTQIHTITWMGAGKTFYTEATHGSTYQDLTLPIDQETGQPYEYAGNAIGGCSDTWMGWSTHDLGNAAGQSAPDDLFMDPADALATVISGPVTFYAVFANETEGGGATESTLSFANTTQRTSLTTTQQVWEQNGITFTNNKGSSTSNVAEYSNPVRCYKNSEIIVEHTSEAITKIVFNCNSETYATALANSIKESDKYTETLNGSVVTITFTQAVASFSATLTADQVRISSIKVTSSNGGGYENYRTRCEDYYSFHTGGADVKENNTQSRFQRVGETTELQITGYTIPTNDTHFFVGRSGWYYDDNLGTSNSKSEVRTWAEKMYLAPTGNAATLGHAVGAVGTLRIFEDSYQENLYVGFIPDGYKLKFGDDEYAITQYEGHDYRSDIVKYVTTTCNNTVSVGVTNAEGVYVATNHTQEMRHVFLDVSQALQGGSWADLNAKFAIYYFKSSNDTDNGWSKFMTAVPGKTNLYEGWYPTEYDRIIFVRLNPEQTEPITDWKNKWNQTGNLQIPTQQNVFKLAQWDNQTTGWTFEEMSGKFRIYDDSGDKNWYAHFYPHYVLTYDKNNANASGKMELQSVSIDAQNKSVTILDNGFTAPEGYRFVGWNTKADGSGTAYAVGANHTLSADITLYAIWEKEYTIAYDANGGTTRCEDDNIYIEGETVKVCPDVPTRIGHTFDGWVYNDNGDKVKEGESFTMPDEDVTLTAQWIINKYTVTLNPNYPTGKTGTFKDKDGNTVSGNLVLTYDYNTASKTIEDLYTSLTLDGYELGGWYNAKGSNPGEVSGSKCTTTGNITGDKTYYAKWTKLYSITLSENGTTTTPTTQTSTSYTLPIELTAGTCENDEKELVGWSTDPIPNPGDKPTSNFYELGATVTLTKDQTTFYAVFATVGEGGVDNTDYSNVHTSNVTLTNEGGTNATNSKVKISGVDYTAVKAGTGSAKGAVKITVPAGTTKLSFHMAGWNGEGGKTISLSGATADPSSFKTVADAGVSGNSTTYTLSGTIANYFYSTTLSNINTETTLTFSNGGADQRFVIWGVNASTGGAISYSDYTTTCVKLPDPVLTFATEPANPIVFTDAVCGGNSSKQSVTVVGENLRDVVNVSVTGPYKIARTSSTALKDFTTSLTLDKTAAGAIHSNYKTVYIISTPPAQSTEATTGTLTFTTTKGNTLTVNLSTPTITCTQYTLTLVDRGVSTEQPTKYYAGETIDEAPADPEGVCTDPIHYVFDGWAAATVAEGSTTYTKVTFPYTVTGNTKFYAVYRYLEGGGNGDYNLVTSALDDWSGDYLIAYSDQIFANGTISGESGIGAKNNKVDLSSNISDNTIPATVGDQYNVTLEAVTGGYVLKTQDGKYNYHTNNTGNGISASTIGYADDYPITVKFVSEEEINLCLGGSAIGSVFRYNAQGFFRFYKNGGQNPVYLYKKADGTTYYTTSPVCGPHLAITEGKEIYVTGGNAGGTRDLVIAQQKVSYKATRLQTSNGLADGTAPDVKVATNGITVGGVVTSDVKVTIDQNKEQQTDGTYTITGTITVQYQPSANNKQEDIQVQLAVDYNAEARDNFTVHARSLPSEFVIVAKSGDKWYALNGDMNNGSSANPANGQVTLDDDANPTKATYAPCNAIYTFDGLPNTGDRTYVRFQGTDGAWLWAASGTNVGIQNNVLKTTPEGSNKAYNWKLYTEDNITYRFGNANNSRQLTLSGEKFGMYASGVQDIRILPYVEKCLYNYAPTNLKVSVLKGTYVTLTWDAVAGATKYQYRTNGTTWTDAGTEPTVTINGLEGGTKYIYYIRAYHEDAGVSQECIDYAEITFTTADCDDVPTNITYTADLNSITVSWTAAAPTATIKLFMNEDGTGGGGTYPGATSPYRISGGLDKNTTYYIQILSDGTCASPIIPVKTEDVELDIVEWKTDGIVVDINTNETVGVTLENEVSYGSGLGTEATELFFSKYYEASYNVKLVAIYNGTKNIIDLTDYIIKYGKTSWESNYITLKDFGATKGQIQPGEEIILYSMQDGTQDDEIMDCVHEDFPDGNWVEVTSSNNEGKGILSFAGDKTLALFKGADIIDIIGAVNGSIPNNSKANAKPSWGDAKGWICATGLSLADDSEIGISTNRCLLVRNNTVTSGANAVASNTTDFVTLCSEWKGAHVLDSDVDNGIQESCENFAYVGTFDYSDYYTKYVPMDGGTSTFDENDRNPDGTVSIYIPDLYKRACSNIRVKLTNSGGEVLTDREYKVPIMITSDQTTAGQAFLELQENLATVEVDDQGNVINTYPLDLDEVREICKTCDVVIRDNATLTKALDNDTNDHPQVNNVMIYEGASLEIPSGADYNYTINSLSLRRKGDIVASAKVEEGGKLHLPASATAPIYLDMRIDANNWHWFTLPYNCNIADVTWVDGTPAQYNKDWFIMYYDGNSRANEQSIYENHWKVYNGTTIEAGKGYIVGIQGDITHPDYTFELRFPMATEVLTNEHVKKTVAVNAWGVNMDITPNKKGWNLVGNPYLDYYKTSENISFTGLSLLKYTGIDPVTGDRLYDDSSNVPFLVTPVDGGWYEYQQELASDVEMMPFTAYFVQVGDPANASHTDGMELHAEFVSDNRGRMSLIRRAPQEVDGEQEPVIVRVEVANAKGESDKTTLIIDDRFTNEYEMNGDFFKWFGDYYRRYTKPVLYSMGADQGKRAFNALSEQLAAQPIPLGMFAAQAGDYTFTLTRKRCDLSRVEEVWLYDATTATYTNLMQQDYTFTTAKTEGEGRFYLSVKLRQNAPTDITDIYGGNIVASAKDGQIIVGGLTDNTQLWIYDATGKLLYTEQTTNFQHVYEAPVAGTYFVRTQVAGQSQTIKVLVE